MSRHDKQWSQSSAMRYCSKTFDLRKAEFNDNFLAMVHPHVASFNLFLDSYLKEIPKTLGPVYISPGTIRGVTELDSQLKCLEFLKVSVSKIEIGKPRRVDNEGNIHADLRQLPKHARLSHTSYCAPMYVTYRFDHSLNDEFKDFTVFSGLCPVMVRSDRCHLTDMAADEVSRYAGEDVNEPGGYFIINGNERAIRFVIQQRTNYPIALKKPRFRERDIFFTEFACTFRCSRRDGTSTNNILFYTEDKQCVLRILVNRSEWTAPFWLFLRSLFPTVQLSQIKDSLLSIANNKEFEFEIDSLWDQFVNSETLFTDLDVHEDRYLALLGYHFYDGLRNRLPPKSTYENAGRLILKEYVMVHTDIWTEKFETLLLMWQKLWFVSHNEIPPENVDSLAFQELLGPGQLFASVLKDSLYNNLQSIRLNFISEINGALSANESTSAVVASQNVFETLVKRVANTPTRALQYFCATGNIRTYQLDLQQTAGWTITADRLNMNRFISHFRAVHRGQFFTKMRTTEVRKLVGEAWGFICPVHTPDGPSCGLLLHLSQDAQIVNDAPSRKLICAVRDYLSTAGYFSDQHGLMGIPNSICLGTDSDEKYSIVVDGVPVARLSVTTFYDLAERFRKLKTHSRCGFDMHTELACFEPGCGAMTSIYLFSSPGRLVRPVRSLETQEIEYIGPLAQPWLNIATSNDEVVESNRALLAQRQILEEMLKNKGYAEHEVTFRTAVTLFDLIKRDPAAKIQLLSKFNLRPRDAKQSSIIQSCPLVYDYVEPSPTSFLSINASLTPLSNHNQSPRNMYQCQMLKQTMGTASHNICWRTDNKSYRILFPSRPLVRAQDFEKYNFDEYPSGTNAVVAVISYTGFDMEDAMIINKHSMERGIFAGCVYKSKFIEAAPTSAKLSEQRNFVFSNKSYNGLPVVEGLGVDGFAHIGSKLVRGSPLYRTEDIRLRTLDGTTSDNSGGHVHLYNEDEEAYVEGITIVSPDDATTNRFGATIYGPRAIITLRCTRNPTIGDKFASRAGQKGILSLLYPPEDMPYSSNGVVPDILFNPHGFPSRMTIGMIVESMAGKVASLKGEFQDSTSFVKYPVNQESNSRWINQNGYHGWQTRDSRYMTTEELAEEEFDNPVDFFGKSLLDMGYQYYGTETMYSGIQGVEMSCQIFTGIIYYQRLRHMVSDKWQCRSTGPIDSLTRQPLKGRKRGGGVRLGEMERDALLAHGSSFIIQDRLLNCSDGHAAFICPHCGSILSPLASNECSRFVGGRSNIPVCTVCDVPCRKALVPYVFRYLSNELIAMNVTIKLGLSEFNKPISSGPSDSTRPLHSRAVIDGF